MQQNEIASRIIEELDHFQTNFEPKGGSAIFPSQLALQREPFVGYVKIKSENGRSEEFLICRNYTPHMFQPAGRHALYGSYLSNNVGVLMARNPGAPYDFDPQFRMVNKCEFRPKKSQDLWDATESRLAWLTGGTFLQSLRKYLAEPNVDPTAVELINNNERKGTSVYSPQSFAAEESLRTDLSLKIQLPSRAILDVTQDEIFRLPFNEKIRISGAPGTGKTTVLLKRLSQKTKREFLEKAEQDLVRKLQWEDNNNWVLFTPSDLLKGYLKEALAKEMLPAENKHVQVYETFRLDVLREAGFIRIGQRGLFTILYANEHLLQNSDFENVLSLNQEFEIHLGKALKTYLEIKIKRFNQQADILKPILDSECDTIRKKVQDMQNETENFDIRDRMRRYREVYTQLNSFTQAFDKTTYPLKDITNMDLRVAYQMGRKIQDEAIDISSKPIGLVLFPQITPIISKLKKELLDLAESLSLKNLYDLIGKSYQEFREREEILEKYFRNEARHSVLAGKISSQEQSVILYQALEFVRKFNDLLPSGGDGVPDPIRQIQSRMKAIIAIDEAADFSPMEIACMERFALPRIGGVSICGDLMQRVTKDGLQAWDELKELSGTYKSYELCTSYRQTATLFNVANILQAKMSKTASNYRSAHEIRNGEPQPLCKKCTETSGAADWIADLIEEILNSNSGHLPGTAILVPDGKDVEIFKQHISRRLNPLGVKVEGSQSGNSLGDESKVRIFPVESIKGLEFEVVFYVGIDRMATIHGDLIDKYLYVGLSRARRFLALVYENEFPKELQCVESMFKTANSFYPM